MFINLSDSVGTGWFMNRRCSTESLTNCLCLEKVAIIGCFLMIK